jgi:hypothetical protein
MNMLLIPTVDVLTAESPITENPPLFKGDLFRPQKTLLYAMIELENNSSINLDMAIYNKKESAIIPTKLTTKTARISEKFSFGKTILSLALICAQKHKKFPHPLPKVIFNENQEFNGIMIHKNTLSVQFHKCLNITVVAAVSNIISQWENNTTVFTDLTFFTVDNVKKLKQFEEMIKLNKFNYDILFIKAGTVTANYSVAGEPKWEKSSARSLFDAVTTILEGMIVSRFIVDDFDTLALKKDDCYVPALFTWLISATQRKIKFQREITHSSNLSITDNIRNIIKHKIREAAHDEIINKRLSFCCDAEYVNSFISSYKIVFNKIITKNDNAVKILKAFNLGDNIIEMLHSNAYHTAASSLGMTANNVSDIIKIIIKENYDKFMKSLIVLQNKHHPGSSSLKSAITNSRISVNQFRRMIEMPYNTTASNTNSTNSKSNSSITNDTNSTNNTSNTNSTVSTNDTSNTNKSSITNNTDFVEYAQTINEKYGKTIERMCDNIRENHCQCCMVPFDKENIAFVFINCCQLIICDNCVFVGKTCINKCPNCMTPLKSQYELMRINPEIDLEKFSIESSYNEIPATEDETLATDAEILASDAGIPATEDEVPVAGGAKKPNKIQALIDILKSTETNVSSILNTIRGSNIIRVEKNIICNIPKLLSGHKNIQKPAETPIKTLVFTMYPESTELILKNLDIKCCKLSGTREQKDAIISEFTNTDMNVLLLTSAKDCGGLDMPFISHLVLYHKVIDLNVMAQVVARGQRLNRTYNLEVTTIMSENE